MGLETAYRSRDAGKSPSPVTCIVSPQGNAYSQTFVKAHIERIPTTVRLLYGGYFPQYRDDGSPLLPAARGGVLLRAIHKGLIHLSRAEYQTAALRRYLRSNHISVVLAEFGPTGVAVMDACRRARVPLVVHFHGYDAYRVDVLERQRSAYPLMFDAASAVIAVSHDMEHQLITLGAPLEKVHYNPYGVDTELFTGAKPGSSVPLFVAVGRFVDKKAPQLTLLALRKTLDVCPDARLLMIGDGPLWEACRHMAAALGMAASVEFTGPRPPDDVAAAMAGARAFVQHSLTTSYGDSEGTPVAILEAGASGLPVVSTRHAGIKDVVVHGETGLLVDEGDVSAMAEFMIQLCRRPALAADLGQKARKRICAEYSMDRSIARLWTIIRAAASG